MKTARLVLATLDPRAPCAPWSWFLLLAAPLWLAHTPHGLFGPEVGGRIVGSLALLMIAMVPSGLGNVGRWPLHAEPAPLPVGRVAGPAAEILTWLGLAGALAAGPMLILARGEPWVGPVMPGAPVPWGGSARALAGLGLALLLALPLAAAASPAGKLRGWPGLLRLLLPWLPVGIAAPAGWLAHPVGLGATLTAQTVAATAALRLRRTGWEDWWPRPPAWLDPLRGARSGLPGEARLAADLAAGLLRGLACALALSLGAWGLIHGACRGWLPEDALIPGILLLATALLAAVLAALDLPLGARLSSWTAPAVPWEILPLPRGAFVRALSLHHAFVWGVFALAAGAGLALAAVGQPPSDPDLLGAEVSLLMLLALLPWGLAREVALATASPERRARVHAVAIVVGPLTILPGALGLAPTHDGDAALDLAAAAGFAVRVLAPALVVGALWLAVAHLLALRASRR